MGDNVAKLFFGGRVFGFEKRSVQDEIEEKLRQKFGARPSTIEWWREYLLFDAEQFVDYAIKSGKYRGNRDEILKHYNFRHREIKSDRQINLDKLPTIREFYQKYPHLQFLPAGEELYLAVSDTIIETSNCGLRIDNLLVTTSFKQDIESAMKYLDIELKEQAGWFLCGYYS